MKNFRFLRPEQDRNKQYCSQRESFLIRSVRPLQYLWFPYCLLYFFSVCFIALSNVDSFYFFVAGFTPEEYNFAALARLGAVAFLVLLPLLTLAALPFYAWCAYRELWAPAVGWPGPLQVYFTDYLSKWRKRWDDEVVVPNQRLAAAGEKTTQRIEEAADGFANVGPSPDAIRRECFKELSDYIPQTDVPYGMSGELEVDYLPDYITNAPQEDLKAVFGAIAYTLMERVPRSLVFYDQNDGCLILLVDLEGTGPSIEHKIMVRLWPEGKGDTRRILRRTRYLALFFEGRYGHTKNFGDGSYHYEGDWRHLLRLNAFKRYTTSGRIWALLTSPVQVLFFCLKLANPFNFFVFLKVHPLKWPYLAYREWKYKDTSDEICRNAQYHQGDFFGFWLLRGGLESVDEYYNSINHPERNEYLQEQVKKEVDRLHTELLHLLSELVTIGPQAPRQKPGNSGLNTV